LDISEETNMHGIIADEQQISRQARSASKLRPEVLRRPDLHENRKRRGTAEIIHAFDRQIPQRDIGRVAEPTGPTPAAPTVRYRDDAPLLTRDGTTHDIDSTMSSDPETAHHFFRNGSVHDLRNLLQTVSSGVSIAESRLEEGRSGEVPEILARIGDTVEKAGALLRQMVRIPHSPMMTVPIVDIGKMLRTLEASLRWALGPRNELVIAISSDLPAIHCMESEFENVVLNLVINARDAMPNGGRVAIEVTRGAGGRVILRIHDTGTGMDPAIAAKAFEPYFTTKGASTGTGLGLAMVAAFARSLGGMARIEQTSPKGTTIALSLPTP
jgi:signal transduction histidine kinase